MLKCLCHVPKALFMIVYKSRPLEEANACPLLLIAVMHFSLGHTLHIFSVSAFTVFSGCILTFTSVASVVRSVVIAARGSITTTVIAATVIVSSTASVVTTKATQEDKRQEGQEGRDKAYKKKKKKGNALCQRRGLAEQEGTRKKHWERRGGSRKESRTHTECRSKRT
ncbi:hypothetical protein BDF14DRAFT_1823359 [Spinellus fusiger]|nr:hypothetical protein BDF14DRAFT_1823359 [Spinellus fusiger]